MLSFVLEKVSLVAMRATPLLSSVAFAISLSRIRGSAAASSSAAATGPGLGSVNEGHTSLSLGPSEFTAPGAFPTSVFASYFNNPTATSAQPLPVISDPVLVRRSS